ncbi:MAG: hypothetical protein M9890_14910 [Thermomicrobiales bacterium]|nr:hypothetical protein [Thermomicrobiales bacterium]
MTMNELTFAELESESLVELPERQLMTGINLGLGVFVAVDLDLGINIGGGDCGGGATAVPDCDPAPVTPVQETPCDSWSARAWHR